MNVQFIYYAFLLFSAGYVSAADTTKGPLLDTKLGKLEGVTMSTQRGAKVYAFLSIPYAQSPVGELRFAAPKPFGSWSGTFNAKQKLPKCPQVGVSENMSEDCLKLSVFSRNLTGNSPVFVHIHGGGYEGGTGGEAGPEYLLDHDVVLVAINYRLGPFGFLSTGTKEVPGNFAFLDQILALKWVQQHIASFGGNPNAVTIHGLSAGSWSVSLLMASPMAKGLFHKAIAMSGAIVNELTIDNHDSTRLLARAAMCPIYDPQDILDCLRQLDWKTIIQITETWSFVVPRFRWTVEFDHFMPEGQQFLPAPPAEIFAKGQYNKVPVLAGLSYNEFDFMMEKTANPTLLHDFTVNWNKYAYDFTYFNATVGEAMSPTVSERLWRLYFGNATSINEENVQKLGAACSYIIDHPVHRFVNLIKNTTTVYYYSNTYVGQRSIYPSATPRAASHSDDLQYIFAYDHFPVLDLDHPDRFMVDRMTKWWTTFVHHAAPIVDGYGVWKPVSSNSSVPETFYIDRETKMGEEPHQDRFKVWDEIWSDVNLLKGNSANRGNFLAMSVLLLLFVVHYFK